VLHLVHHLAPHLALHALPHHERLELLEVVLYLDLRVDVDDNQEEKEEQEEDGGGGHVTAMEGRQQQAAAAAAADLSLTSGVALVCVCVAGMGLLRVSGRLAGRQGTCLAHTPP
jgi:hypothetical protein